MRQRKFYPPEHSRSLAIAVALLPFTAMPPAFSEETEGFTVAIPESQGIDSNRLREMSEWVRSEELDVRSLLLVRDGHLVLEWYAGEVTRDSNHNVYSVTKSVVGLLAGISIDRERISGTEATLGDLLPGVSDPAKSAITLDQLLTMRSGLPVARANKPDGPERELFDRINDAPDRSGFILARLDPVSTPGRTFAYNNIDPQLVGSAIAEATGKSLPDFAEESLFEPLDFENAAWQFPDDAGQVPGGYGLRLRAIDLAKLGQLVLHGGTWSNRQVISEDWITASTHDHTETGYGYYWWLDQRSGIIGAKGVRGQRLEIVPAKKLVFVVTAELPPARVSTITSRLLDEFVFPAVKSDEPLPENPDTFEKLEAELALAARYRPGSRDTLPSFRLPR